MWTVYATTSIELLVDVDVSTESETYIVAPGIFLMCLYSVWRFSRLSNTTGVCSL